MAISLIDGSEFLHLPKTGGSWVTKVLEDNGLVSRHEVGLDKHADYDRVLLDDNIRFLTGKQHLKQAAKLAMRKLRRTNPAEHYEPRQPFRFCFVRHPLAWYESWWKYMSGRGWNDWGRVNSARHWHPNSILNGLGSNDFNEFVESVVQRRPGYVSELFFSFTKSGISYIGKNENLAHDLSTVLDYLKLPYDKSSLVSTGRINASEKPDAEIKWDPQLRKTVMLLELPALTHFGYLTETEADEIGLPGVIKPNEALQSITLHTTSHS